MKRRSCRRSHPSNLANWNRNEHYKSEEEYLYALADALREEYRAIIDAGLVLQVDDPLLASYYVDASRAERRGVPQMGGRHASRC